LGPISKIVERESSGDTETYESFQYCFTTAVRKRARG
jgi:hypothetical protein